MPVAVRPDTLIAGHHQGSKCSETVIRPAMIICSENKLIFPFQAESTVVVHMK
jgi:hypothetical protein